MCQRRLCLVFGGGFEHGPEMNWNDVTKNRNDRVSLGYTLSQTLMICLGMMQNPRIQVRQSLQPFMLPRISSGTMCSRTAWWWLGLAWAFYCKCLMFFCVFCSSIFNSDIQWCKMSTIPVLITASQKVDTCRDHLQDQLWLWIQSDLKMLASELGNFIPWKISSTWRGDFEVLPVPW